MKILDNQEICTALERHWQATVALDLDRVHDIYHDDLIVEFPQSGERISGERNL
jgi:ketosteroid isomerase-like protein